MGGIDVETRPGRDIRQRIEDALGRWAHTVFRFRWLVVAVMTLITVGLGTFIPDLEMKMSTDDFLFEDDPVRAEYDRFKADFGQDQVAILSVEPPELFDLGFLEKLRTFHDALENEVPYLEDITSLVNVRSVYGRGDELIVEDLLDEMPQNQADLDALEARVLSTPSYMSSAIVSQDGRATSVILEAATSASRDDDADELGGFGDDESTTEGSQEEAASNARPTMSSEENRKLVEKILEIVERFDAPDFKIRAGGGTLLTYQLTAAMNRDVPRFFGGGLVAIGVCLVLLFRRFAPVALCFLVVVPALVSTFGLAALLGIAISPASQIVPSFLLSIGVGYSVHLVTVFLRDLNDSGSTVGSLESAIRHSGLPIMMTALTTATGVCSFMVAEMMPVTEMGALATVGVVITLVYALVLLPALLSIFPIHARKTPPTPMIDALLGRLASFSAHHPWQIIAGVGVLTFFAIAAIPNIRLSSDPISWFPEDHDFAIASDFIKDRFGGSTTIEVVIDASEENALHEPALMKRIASLEGLVAELRAEGAQLTRTVSIADIARETHQALNANDPSFYAVPDSRALLAQELLLFENGGSDDLEKFVDTRFSKARFTVRSTWQDGVDTSRFLDESGSRFQDVIGADASVSLTGMSAVIARTVGATIETMIRSYLLALVLITPLMIILIGSLRAGLVSMVPNLVPILLTLGLMAVIDIPLDMFTLLAGCIAIGLAVDDSIHFISGFRRYLALGHDPVVAVEMTMQSTGRALLFTSVVLTSGFLVLTFSNLLNLEQVGVLTSFAVMSAFLLDVTVTPALLVLTHGGARRALDS